MNSILIEKEASALKLIENAIKKTSNPCVAFSCGKDSTVVKYLVELLLPDIRSVFNNTKVEFKETNRFKKTIKNLDETLPIKTFWKCVELYGLPVVKQKAKSHGNRCCYYLKEKPAMIYYKENEVDLAFTGLTMAESRSRMMVLKYRGPLYYAKSWKVWKCHPIWDWTEAEVWRYIREKGIRYNPCYDPPRCAVRCGCEPCTAYLSWKKRLARENFKMLKVVLKLQGQSQLKFDCRGEIEK